MQLILTASKNGEITCKADNIFLHSPFDPTKEAKRYLEENTKLSSATKVILIAACLNYIGSEIKKKYPTKKVILIELDPFFFNNAIRKDYDYIWHPSCKESLYVFLQKTLSYEDIGSILILEWKMGIKAFPSKYRECLEVIKVSLNELGGSSNTIKTFGKRWLKNAFKTYLKLNKIIKIYKTEKVIVIAAAGPSLNQSLKEVKKYRNNFILIAVSSSLLACKKAGLDPDIIINTDGGYWSRLNMYAAINSNGIICTSLIANTITELFEKNYLLLLNQNSFIEHSMFLKDLNAIDVLPHGTVTGSAIMLGLKITNNNILLIGADFSSLKTQTHCRPHAFDSFFLSTTNRIKSYETIVIEKYYYQNFDKVYKVNETKWFQSKNQATYADSISILASIYKNRIFRLNPSAVDLINIEDIVPLQLENYFKDHLSIKELEIENIITNKNEKKENIKKILYELESIVKKSILELKAGRFINDKNSIEILCHIDIVDFSAIKRNIEQGIEFVNLTDRLEKKVFAFLDEIKNNNYA